jgi:hypothetical protein
LHRLPADPIALYGALAAVGAITAALQTSAVFASYADVNSIEDRFDRARPSTQDRADAVTDARSSLTRATLLNLPAVVVNALVLSAWGDVTLARAQRDWVLVLPWAGVLLTFLFLVGAVLYLRHRLKAVRDQSR